MSKDWKTLNSEIVFDPHVRMRIRKDTVELPNGRVLDDFYLWLEGDVALIVPITKDGKFILVKQYKHGIGREVIEFPAGMVDDNEDPAFTAKRELQEETGYFSDNFKQITILHNSPTKVVSDIYVYLAKDCVLNGKQSLDENEDIEVLLKTKEEVEKMIVINEINTAGTISAFYFAQKHF